MQKVTKEELLAKAKKPAEDAMKLHSFYHGKMQTMPKCQVRDVNDFAIYYTPGVAEPCRAIQANEGRFGEITNRWNTMVVDSKGTLHPRRKDLDEKKEQYPDKWRFCTTTNPEGKTGGLTEAL